MILINQNGHATMNAVVSGTAGLRYRDEAASCVERSVLLEDPEIRISHVAMKTSVDAYRETISSPSLSCTAFLRGAGYRGFRGAAPVSFRSDHFALGYTPSEVQGFGFLPSGQVLEYLMLELPLDMWTRCGVADLCVLPRGTIEKFDAGEAEAVVVQFVTPPRIAQCVREILESALSAALQTVFLRAKALEIFTLACAQIGQLASGPPPAPLSRSERQRIHEARTLLRERTAERWTVGTLAQTVGLNEKKLKLGFRQLFSSSVYRYLQTFRLESAAQLLLESEHDIGEIAHRVGFSSISHFDRYFRRHYRMSPSAYRRSGNRDG